MISRMPWGLRLHLASRILRGDFNQTSSFHARRDRDERIVLETHHTVIARNRGRN